MNQKELNEIRRHLTLDKNNIRTIYGCYVNGNREIIAYLDESLGLMAEFEAEKYLGFLKKVLSPKPPHPKTFEGKGKGLFFKFYKKKLSDSSFEVLWPYLSAKER